MRDASRPRSRSRRGVGGGARAAFAAIDRTGLGVSMTVIRFARVDRRGFLRASPSARSPRPRWPPGRARAGADNDQAEWRQSYETSDAHLRRPRDDAGAVAGDGRRRPKRRSRPIRALSRAAAGTRCPTAPSSRSASKSKAVQALRQRLIASGDLDPVAGMGADVRFVRRGGGQALPGPPRAQSDRRRQRRDLRRTQRPRRGAPAAVADQHRAACAPIPAISASGSSMVNIPAAAVETVEDGVVHSHHAAGVGKIDRQSPIMQTKATEMNFNPFWTVPPSLIKKDLIPKMQADPNYLTDEKIRVFNKEGQEVSPPVDQLEQRRGDPLQVSPGSGRGPQFARLRAHQHPQPLRRLHARHAVEGRIRRRLPLRLVGLRARAGRARLCRLAARRTIPAGAAIRSTR